MQEEIKEIEIQVSINQDINEASFILAPKSAQNMNEIYAAHLEEKIGNEIELYKRDVECALDIVRNSEEKIKEFEKNIEESKTQCENAEEKSKEALNSLNNYAKIDFSNLSSEGQAKLNSKVNKTGDTMTGPLKCRGGIDLQAPGATKGETPDRAYYWGIRFNDDTNANTAGTTWQQQRLGVVECALNTDNSVSLTMNAYQNVNASGSGARFTLKTSATGDQRCSFPICTAKATTTSSAAADKVVVVVQNYLNGTSWYRVWSDGFCEQGGQMSTGTVTFLKTYTSVPSVLIAPSGQAASSNYNNILYSVTITGFTMYVRHSWGGWVAYGYIN